MPTIDLTSAPPPPRSALDGAPRRVGLNLRELLVVAERAGGAPLPFQVAPPSSGDAMESRLGSSPRTTDDRAYRAVVESLRDPEQTLAHRGLLVDGRLDDGLAGAVGLLATPEVALDIDVAMAGVQAKAWHRQARGAVASLATVDGVVFELAWFGPAQWPAELSRVASPSEEVALRASAVPALVDLPYELADGAAEALRTGRGDLVPVLVERHAGSVRGEDGVPLAAADVARVLHALGSEARGRLRALMADTSGESVAAVGVVSWTLLADGWHALRPHGDRGDRRVEIRRVEPADLAAVLGPVAAEAVR